MEVAFCKKQSRSASSSASVVGSFAVSTDPRPARSNSCLISTLLRNLPSFIGTYRETNALIFNPSWSVSLCKSLGCGILQRKKSSPDCFRSPVAGGKKERISCAKRHCIRYSKQRPWGRIPSGSSTCLGLGNKLAGAKSSKQITQAEMAPVGQSNNKRSINGPQRWTVFLSEALL